MQKTSPIKNVLTFATASLNQRVEVYSHPHVDPPAAYLGEKGTIKILPSSHAIFACIAGVQLDGYGKEVFAIPLYQLHPLD